MKIHYFKSNDFISKFYEENPKTKTDKNKYKFNYTHMGEKFSILILLDETPNINDMLIYQDDKFTKDLELFVFNYDGTKDVYDIINFKDVLTL